MKLYGEIVNENGSKVSKGGNESLTINLDRGNRRMIEFYFTLDNGLLVIDMLNLSDGSTTRLLEREDNPNLPEHTGKTQNS